MEFTTGDLGPWTGAVVSGKKTRGEPTSGAGTWNLELGTWNLELRSAEMIALIICSADAGCGSRPVVADRGHGEARDPSLLGYVRIAYIPAGRRESRTEPRNVIGLMPRD